MELIKQFIIASFPSQSINESFFFTYFWKYTLKIRSKILEIYQKNVWVLIWIWWNLNEFCVEVNGTIVMQYCLCNAGCVFTLQWFSGFSKAMKLIYDQLWLSNRRLNKYENCVKKILFSNCDCISIEECLTLQNSDSFRRWKSTLFGNRHLTPFPLPLYWHNIAE